MLRSVKAERKAGPGRQEEGSGHPGKVPSSILVLKFQSRRLSPTTSRNRLTTCIEMYYVPCPCSKHFIAIFLDNSHNNPREIPLSSFDS